MHAQCGRERDVREWPSGSDPDDVFVNIPNYLRVLSRGTLERLMFFLKRPNLLIQSDSLNTPPLILRSKTNDSLAQRKLRRIDSEQCGGPVSVHLPDTVAFLRGRSPSGCGMQVIFIVY